MSVGSCLFKRAVSRELVRRRCVEELHAERGSRHATQTLLSWRNLTDLRARGAARCVFRGSEPSKKAPQKHISIKI